LRRCQYGRKSAVLRRVQRAVKDSISTNRYLDDNLCCRGHLAALESDVSVLLMHPIYKVESFRIEAPYTLRVRFDDGTEQVIDFRPMLAGALYGPLRDLTVFNQVRIDPEVHTLVWPNGADFDPASLHDWATHAPSMIARAQQWNLSPT
jgi:Protein of unknown function (DUF2442)